MDNEVMNMSQVIERHGIRRYVMMRAVLKNRFTIVISHALDEWKEVSPVCLPLFCAELGNYYSYD